MSSILIVEDEEQMRLGLKDNLQFEGYSVDLAEDGEEGLQKILNTRYDLVLLDVMLPKLSGFDICKKARAAGVTCPILMLTAKGEEIDKVLGLEIGADDYITKPFGLRELLARIKAALRRADSGEEETSEVSIGRLRLEFASYNAFEGDKSVEMTHREFEILKYLWDHKNETVSRDKLLTEIWGYESLTTTRTVDNFILKLRRKIEHDTDHPQMIITVHGIGYKLVQKQLF